MSSLRQNTLKTQPDKLGGVVEPVIKPLSTELRTKVANFKVEVAKEITEQEKSDNTLSAISLYNQLAEAGHPPVMHLDGVDFRMALLNSLK